MQVTYDHLKTLYDLLAMQQADLIALYAEVVQLKAAPTKDRQMAQQGAGVNGKCRDTLVPQE